MVKNAQGNLILTQREVKILDKFLANMFISYENQELISVVKQFCKFASEYKDETNEQKSTD